MSMYIRICVAAIDWNRNTNRPQKVDVNGNPLYRIKVDRYGNNAIAPVKVEKSNEWQTDAFDACIEALILEQIPTHQYPVVDEDSIHEKAEFSKEEAVRRLQKRMRKEH